MKKHPELTRCVVNKLHKLTLFQMFIGVYSMEETYVICLKNWDGFPFFCESPPLQHFVALSTNR